MNPNATHMKSLIEKERLRHMENEGFAFIPNRFLRKGFFASLDANERSLYFLLILASDRRGLSYYHYDTLCSILECPLHDYIEARDRLIKKDLIAFDGSRFQVLSLPRQPVLLEKHSEPSEVRNAILHTLRATHADHE